MPSSSGPNTVSDSSVVFIYDTGDTSNSWEGEPTTNLASGGGLIGMSGIDLSYLGIENGWMKYSMSGTFTGGGYPYIMYLQPVTFTGGTIYSTQAIVKTNALGKFNYFGTSGVSYVNEPKNNEGTLVQNTLADGSSYVARVGFIYTNTTTQPGYLFTNPINNTTFNPSTDFVYLKNFQIEQKAYTTPFTPSSRSNTQGLLDISGRNNVVTLANMTYGVNNAISFDGTDDYISVNNSSALQVGDVFTISAWINPANLNSRYGVFSTRRFNTTGCWQFEVGTASGGTNRVAVTGIGTWIFETANNVISPNVWTNICFVKQGNTIQGGTLYINGNVVSPATTTAYSIANNSDIKVVGSGTNLGQFFPGKIANVTLYNRILTATEVQNNYLEFKTRFNTPIYIYDEGGNASPYLSNWNNSTTYTMADFGGIPNVTAHGWSTGPATYTLTLNNLPPHTRIRYKVYWHLVDSLDNETNQLFIMNSSGGETEILRFTKQYNLAPAISIAASPGTYAWSGPKTYTYRPWANGAYGQDGYIIVDSGIVNHTSTTFTARHVLGADQAQSDEAEYLSHVVVELY